MFNKNLIISLINKRGWSRYKLCKEASLAQSTLSDILTGKNANPRMDTIQKIADALSVSVNDFFDEESNKTINNIEQINTLSKEEKIHIEDLRKLNDIGKKKVITYTQDLLDNPKFATTNDEICASLVTKHCSPYLVACHDDNLSDEEKTTMNNKINEFLNKNSK